METVEFIDWKIDAEPISIVSFFCLKISAASITAVEEEQLVPSALMKDDLDIESLDFVDIAVIIEKEFKVKPTSEHIEKIIKLDDLYNFIAEHSNK